MHHLYIITDPLRLQADILKIGIHKGDLTSLRQRYLTAIPQLIVCEFLVCPAAPACERLVLNLLDKRRLLNDEGNKSEWIQLPLKKLRQCVCNIVEQARTWSEFDQPDLSEDPNFSPIVSPLSDKLVQPVQRCAPVATTKTSVQFPDCATSHEPGHHTPSDHKGSSLSDSAFSIIPDVLLLKLAKKINRRGLYGSPSREGVFRLRWHSLDGKMQSQGIGVYKFPYPTYMIEYIGQMITSLAKRIGKWKRGNRRQRTKWLHVVDPSVSVEKCVCLLSETVKERKSETPIAPETTTSSTIETACNTMTPPLGAEHTGIPSVGVGHDTTNPTLGAGIELQQSTGAEGYSLKVNITADVAHSKMSRGKQDVHLDVKSQIHPKGIRSGFNDSTWGFNQNLRTSRTTVGYDGNVQISTTLL